MKYAFVQEQTGATAVATMCRALGVSRSGYYRWIGRGASLRKQADLELLERIREVHRDRRMAYGAKKTWIELRRRGVPCSKHRVARLRCEHGIEAERKRRFRGTIRHRETQQPVPNVLARCFTAPAINRVWVGDMTCVTTAEGWLHLAVLLDLYARRVVGWAMGARADEELPVSALRMAIAQRRPEPGLVHHTDQGSQYRAAIYRRELVAIAAVASNSAKGTCYDNAVAESFFSNLKNELVHHTRFRTRDEARAAIFSYIEIFYNRQRIHETLGYRTPDEVERASRLTCP